MSFLFGPKTAATFETSLAVPEIDADDAYYRRLGAAPRDLLGSTLQRAQNLCVALFRGNPIANRLIRIYVSFLAGDGFTIKAHNPEVDAVLTEAWKAPRNKLHKHHSWWARDWLLFGEGPHPVTPDAAGNVTVGYIDPTTITKVDRDPRNNMILTDIHVSAGGGETKPLSIVTTDTDLLSPSVGLLKGEVFFWPLERIAAATRGTPLMLPVLDWLDAYDQVLWEHVERIKAMRAFFWDVEVDGGKQQVELAKREWGLAPPKSGSVRFRSSGYRVKAESPQLGTVEDVKSLTHLLRHVATGGGVAPHWLGEPEDANRSTAEQMDIPVLRGLTDIQAEWAYENMTELCRYIIDAKVAAGMLPATLPRHDENNQPIEGSQEPARDLFEVVPPEIASAQVETAAASLASVAQALNSLHMMEAVTPEVASFVVRRLLPLLGINAEDLPADDEEALEDMARSSRDASDETDELEGVLAAAAGRA